MSLEISDLTWLRKRSLGDNNNELYFLKVRNKIIDFIFDIVSKSATYCQCEYENMQAAPKKNWKELN